MRYLGSKRQIAKHILPIMLKNRNNGQCWVEPFVGGGNMICRVTGGIRIGSDSNKYAIQALLSIRDKAHLLPKNNSEFTEDDYRNLRKTDDYEFKGFAGFSYSFGGKWLGGWARWKSVDYVRQQYKHAQKQRHGLFGTILVNFDYRDLIIPENSIIYCDPPYQNTTKYSSEFDSSEFFDWCRAKNSEGHKLFISEFSAPRDFKCIFCLERKTHINGIANSKIERLFTLPD